MTKIISIVVLILIILGGGLLLINSNKESEVNPIPLSYEEKSLEDIEPSSVPKVEGTQKEQSQSDLNENTNQDNLITVCTQDAMQCPDGSFVGRTGPNCEFVCPELENDKVEPVVMVVSPNGGEIWSSDNEYTVSWSYSGLAEEDKVNVGFRSSDDNQNMCWLESVDVGLESFKVTPEEIDCNVEKLQGEYKFQIVVDKYGNGKGVADMSDDFFTIE